MAWSAAAGDLTSFELLITVARAGSIGQAAKEHGLSQPAASIRLRQLESRLGVNLLERSAYGTRLTAAGELVVGWAQPVLDRAAELEAGLATVRTGRRTRLRIAAVPVVAEHLLPRWLLGVRSTQPGLTVALAPGDTGEVAGRVLAGRAELGFVDGPELPGGLQTRVVGHDELALVVAPSHRWARRRTPLTVAEIAATPLVGERDACQRMLKTRLAEPPVLAGPAASKAVVVDGLAPAVFSTHAVGTDLGTGTLVRVRLPDAVDPVRRLRAVWPRGTDLPAAATALLAVALR